MELLLVLIGEFLAVPALAAGLFAVTLLTGLIEAAFWGVALFASAAAAIRARVWLRRLRWTVLGLFGAAVLGVILLNTVFFEPALRWGFRNFEERSGLAVTFASAKGNFLSGTATLTEVRVHRPHFSQSEIDLTAREVRIDVHMRSALRKEIRIESLEIAGLKGFLVHTRSPGPRRDFRIDRLVLDDTWLRFRDHPFEDKTAVLTLRLDRLECAPFRRRSAVFDTLFRSNASGTIDEAPFSIRSGEGAGGRSTFWKGEGIPLRFLADYAGGAFAWFRSGTADVDVVDAWKDGDVKEIDMHWKLRLKAFTAEVPEGLAGWRRPIAEAAVAFLNRHPAELPLEFDLTVNKDDFTGATSVEATGLLVAVGHAATKRLAEIAALPAEMIKELGKRGLEGFRHYLDRWRKK